MMAKSFAERLREDRRLVLLKLLADFPDYRSNSSQLHAGLHFLGIAGARDDVNTDLHWLQDQGYLALNTSSEGVYVVALTLRGHEVATGKVVVPGVSRPGPG